MALHENIELDLAVAAPRGLITSYAADDASVAQVAGRRQLMGPNLTCEFMLLYTIPAKPSGGAAIERTPRRSAAGALTPCRYTVSRSIRSRPHMTRSSRAPSGRSSWIFHDDLSHIVLHRGEAVR